MADSTITFRGPFSDNDITAFWRLMQSMEAKNPEARYTMVIDAPVDVGTAEALRRLDQIAPLAEGYARTKGYSKKETGH